MIIYDFSMKFVQEIVKQFLITKSSAIFWEKQKNSCQLWYLFKAIFFHKPDVHCIP